MGKVYAAYADIQIKTLLDGYRASGRSLCQFAKSVGVPASSLQRWLSASAREMPLRKRKHIPTVVYPHVELYLCTFIKETRSQGLGVTNSDVRRKALEYAAEHGMDDFKASDGWITRFKKRYAWVYRVPTKKARKAFFTEKDLEDEEEFFLKLEEFVHIPGLPADRVFNFDQTMIRLVSPQPKTISPKGAKEVSVKHPPGEKEGITISLTIRADGGKHPAIIVFKGGKGGVLSDNIMAGLVIPPNVIVWSAPSTWWTERLDHKYIAETFLENEHQKILVRDALPVHKLASSAVKLEERNVVQVFVPPGRTGDYQPLDVGVNKPFKAYYRAEYSAWRLMHSEVTKSNNLKKPNRQDFINMISNSWENVSAECVRKSFVGARVMSGDEPGVAPVVEEESSNDDSVLEVSLFSDSMVEEGDENCEPVDFGNGLPL